jgi:hypothetical protein
VWCRQPIAEPFSYPDWLVEAQYDTVRALAHVGPDGCASCRGA